MICAEDVPPHGLQGLQARFGRLVLDRDPRGGYRIVSPIGWELANMTLIRELPGIPNRKLYVNKAMRGPLLRALETAAKTCPDYKVKTIGCWSVRYKRTKAAKPQISVHAWGLAVDINQATNPMRKPLTTDMPPEFIAAFEAEGFRWGGNFPTPDPMHFQWVTGY